MTKFWRVLTHEYLRHVLRKRFILTIISLPLVIVLAMGVSMAAVLLTLDNSPIGYVDHSGWLDDPVMPEDETGMFAESSQILRYDNEELGMQALDEKDIQALYVLDENYLQNGKVEQIANNEPDSSARGSFRYFLRLNLLRDFPQDVANRILEGNEVTVKSVESEREFIDDEWYNLIIPMFMGVILIMIVNISGGYLLQAVVEEKENRTMEIVVTSLSPLELMGGKIAGNLSVGLTQLFVWALFPMLAFVLMKNTIPFLENVSIDTQFIIISLLTLVFSFIMVAALMAAVGATATEAREAQQITALFTIPLMIPYWMTTVFIENPNGLISVILSLFPLTAPVSLPLRVAYGDVPFWQLGLSLLLLACFAAGAVWLAARAFRLGMLRYGKRLSLKELFRKAK